MRILHLTAILIVSLIFCSFKGEAQSKYSVSGKAVSNNVPVEFAVVALRNVSDSVVQKIAYTDTSGNFRLVNVVNGTYYIQITQLGHLEFNSKSIVVADKDLNVGTYSMQVQENQLHEMVVSATRPLVEVMPDRTIFNVKNTINATGSNGFELLRKTPGVIIDNNNNIILEGKTGVRIYIDGKQTVLAGDDLTNYLASLQSSDIDALEIITQPSSKYDAEGNAGIINIKLAKDKNHGTNGTANLGYSYGRNHRGNGSLNLNHRNKKLNVFANYTNQIGDRWNFLKFDRLQEGVRYVSNTDNITDRTTHNLRTGVDFFANRNHTFGILVSGNMADVETSGLTSSEILSPDRTEHFMTLEADNLVIEANEQFAYNLNYVFEDTSNHRLSIDLDYATYGRRINNYQPNLYRDGATDQVLFENNYRMITPTDIEIRSAKFDYEQLLGKGTLTLGAKVVEVRTTNDFEFYNVFTNAEVLNLERTNYFTYVENINAGYLNYAVNLSDKWSVQAGVRAEQTNSVGNLESTQQNANKNVERHYLNWFPSGGVTFKQSRTSTWSLTGSRRIQRPDYQSLNPFTAQINELGYRQGNPFLQPQYTTNIKISNLYKYRLNTSISYSYIEDFFAQVTDTLGTNKTFLIPRNVANQQVISINVGYPFQIKKWWSGYVSLNAYNSSFISKDVKFQAVNRSTLNIYAQQSFLIRPTLKLQLSGWFNTPSIWGGTYLVKSMGSFNVALEKKFKNENMNAKIAFNDIFFTSPWRADLIYGAVDINGTGGGESRNVNVTFSYRFGNKNVKKQRNRKSGVEDETDRL